MLFIVVPWLFALNRLIIGPLYFQDLRIFVSASILTFVAISVSWQLHTWLAVTIRDRFPRDSQANMRMALAIPLFILITALLTTLFFWGYDAAGFPGADFRAANYQIALLMGAIVNVLATFVHEGVVRFEKWKATLVENEQLKKEYMQSQLLGLKSQINPHFLFNSLNSLSSLINEDEQEAELFLDEMSKVYRYLLRSNDEELVALQTELDFIRSYFYLLKTRHGRALELHIHAGAADAEKCLPPLTLQMLLEEVFNSNAGTRDHPTVVSITVVGDVLEVRNTIQKRISEEAGSTQGNLENVINKFWLLCQQRVEVADEAQQRVVRIPLITEKRGKAA